MGESPGALAHHLSYLQLDLTDPDGATALVIAIINAHYDFAAMLLDERPAGVNLLLIEGYDDAGALVASDDRPGEAVRPSQERRRLPCVPLIGQAVADLGRGHRDARDELLGAAQSLAREIADHTSAISVALTRQMMWRMLGADHPMEAHKIDSRGILILGQAEDVQ